MNDVPVQLIVAAFQDENTAKAALQMLKQLQRTKMIKIENAAVLRKNEKGKLQIHETADIGGSKGAALGGVAGAVIGLLAGPALLVPAAVGALVGGLTARLRDTGFSNQRLNTLGESLKPGSSAIIAVVEHRWVAELEKELAEAGADLLTAEISADIAAQLESGHETAYSAIASESGFSAGRISVGEEDVEGERIVVDDSGEYGGRFFATDEGFFIEGFSVDEEGAEYEMMIGTVEEEEAQEDQEE